MRTWHWEALVAAGVLGATWAASGCGHREALGSLAVFYGFMHAQVAFRFSEAAEDRGAAPDPHAVACHAKMASYYLKKEVLWLLYFLRLGAWSALVGVGLALGYPLWRRYHRRRRLSELPGRHSAVYKE